MEYKCNEWIENGNVKCASQLCNECDKKETNNCVEVIIVEKDKR